MLNINNEKVLFDSKFIGVKIKNGFIYVEEPWCNNQGVAILPYVLKDNQYYYLQIHKEKNPAHEIVSKISQYSTITGGLESMDYYTTVVKEMWEEVGIDISGNNVLINRFNHSFSNKSSNKKWFLYAINLTNLNLAFYKNMGLYKLHRSNELDHEHGRPAILLKYKFKKSLIWCGTSKKDLVTKEKPLTINLSKTKTYFYSTGRKSKYNWFK